MTQDEFLKIKKAIDKAEEDDTPYAGVVDDKIVINGNANNTELKKHDYEVKFILPKEMKSMFPDAEEHGKYILATIEYKDVYITPRQNLKVTSAMAQILPLFRKLQEDGDIESLSDADAIEIYGALDDSVIDAFYRLVSVALNVDESLVDYMAVSSVIGNTVQIIQDFPNAVNEADLFFA